MTHYGDTQSWKAEAEQLREELATERKRREEAEAHLAEANATKGDMLRNEERSTYLVQNLTDSLGCGHKDIYEAMNDLRTRAEQAERERDAARDDLALSEAHVVEERNGRERAEADKAACIEAIQRARNLMLYPAVPWDEVVPDVLRVLAPAAEQEPGAALLERMRALEEVHSVACEMNAGDTSTAAWTRLHDVLSAVDAVSPKTK